MSDWADFCELTGIDPNNPDEFDDLLEKYSKENEKVILVDTATGKKYSFKSLADPACQRCSGTGYIGKFKWNCSGRCFKCISDSRWDQLRIEN